MDVITRIRPVNKGELGIIELMTQLDKEKLEPLVQSYKETSMPLLHTDQLIIANNDRHQTDSFSHSYSYANLKVNLWLKTDYGKESREEVCNQDCYGILFSPSKQLIRIAVADGLGSSIGAEIASREACKEILSSPQISPQTLQKVSHHLHSQLPKIAKRIVNSFPQQSEKAHRNFLMRSMATTIQVLEFDFARQIITFLKLGDGEAWVEGHHYPDTQGYRTLHVSPFLKNLPTFNQNPQAVFQHLPMNDGFYMLATDGVPKICHNWVDRSQENPKFFHWSLPNIARKAKCDNKDNITLGIVKITSTSPQLKENLEHSFLSIPSFFNRKKG